MAIQQTLLATALAVLTALPAPALAVGSGPIEELSTRSLPDLGLGSVPNPVGAEVSLSFGGAPGVPVVLDWALFPKDPGTDGAWFKRAYAEDAGAPSSLFGWAMGEWGEPPVWVAGLTATTFGGPDVGYFDGAWAAEAGHLAGLAVNNWTKSVLPGGSLAGMLIAHEKFQPGR